jgi:hypothetical protein
MERNRMMSEKYLREQFETYWPRLERKIPAGVKAFMKSIEVAAREFFDGYEKGARRRPHTAKKAASRRTRKTATT